MRILLRLRLRYITACLKLRVFQIAPPMAIFRWLFSPAQTRRLGTFSVKTMIEHFRLRCLLQKARRFFLMPVLRKKLVSSISITAISGEYSFRLRGLTSANTLSLCQLVLRLTVMPAMVCMAM